MRKSNRRFFIKNSLVGAGAMGIPASLSSSPIKNNRASLGGSDRNVWIASLTQDGITGSTVKETIQAAIKQMEYALPFSPDIYCLPEVFHVAGLKGGRPSIKEAAEDGTGNIIAPFQHFAEKHSCYIVCDVYTQHRGKYYNAAILIDRKGKVAGEYQKARLTVNEMEKGLTPGPLEIPVFQTDFGVIGIQICHDIQWSDGWEQLAKKGAEIVFWPSAFAGGKRINMRAWTNQYCVVSSTRKDTTKICDITGEEIAVSGNWNTWGVCAPVNLEKAFLHSWPYSRKFPAIQKKYGRKVNCYSLDEEEISIIESLEPGLKVKDILEEFGLVTYKESLSIAEEQQAKLRVG
ncbi:MAG: carbon-nitrogen hydrolase family protein [Chitinophagaceae bacterium]|nr:carbon-nitrogen hydrolase family protein [Chitinophagaceae bacterium]